MKKENMRDPQPHAPHRVSRLAGQPVHHTRTRPNERTLHQTAYRDRPVHPARRVPVGSRPVRRRRIPPLRLAVYTLVPLLAAVLLLSLLWPKSPAPAGEPVSSLPFGAVPPRTDLLPEGFSSQEAEPGAETVDTEEIRQLLEANPDHNTETLLLLLEGDEEAISFVACYPEKYRTKLDCTLTENDLQVEEDRLLPLFMQWDERWGYTDYGGYVFGTNACGPTTLSMVAVALTGDTSLDPRTVADFAEENGYVAANGQGSAWTLMSEGSTDLGLVAEEIYPMESMVRSAVESGQPVVCVMGPGHFTTGGHYIVICGTDGDRFLINDCNSYTRSAQSWVFSDFEEEINCLWAFSPAEEDGGEP